MRIKRRTITALPDGYEIVQAGAMDLNAVTMSAAVDVIAAAGDGKPPTFTTNAYNGGLLKVANYPHPVVVDLAGLQIPTTIKANMDHDVEKRVGHADKFANDGKQLLIAGVISADNEHAREVVSSAKSGYPWEVSIEASPLAPPEMLAAGKSLQINGQTINGPAIVLRRSQLFGLAFLGRGADGSTVVSIAAKAGDISKGEKKVDEQFKDWLVKAGFAKPEDLTEQQLAAVKPAYDAAVRAAATEGVSIIKAAAPGFDIDGLKAAYAGHEAALETMAFKYAGEVDAHKLAEVKASAMKDAVLLKAKAIEQEWSPLQFEAAAVKAASAVELELVRAGRPTGPAIHTSRRDLSNDVLQAAAMNSLGMKTDGEFKPEVLEAAHKNFRNMGLQELILACANAAGYIGRQRIGRDNMSDVMRYAMPPVYASSFSTVSLAGILSNTGNKSILEGFQEEDDAWRQLADVVTVSNFYQRTRYRMLDDMEYELLGPNGEIAHGKVGEESFTHSAKTYAKMFAITREQIINDDMSAFNDVRTRLGRGAARKMVKLFWTSFMDNSSFFTAGRTNYITGATSNLGTDGVGLQEGILAYRKLKSTDKKQVGKGNSGVGGTSIGKPSLLVVPPELEFIADKLYTSGNLSTTQDDNIHRNKYKPIVVNELSDSAYTGNSTKIWYLFGSVLKPMTVSFLNGVQTPTVESSEVDFNQLGIQFRGYHDFGVDQAEWLSGIKSKGEA
jgi:hypothetical protein